MEHCFLILNQHTISVSYVSLQIFQLGVLGSNTKIEIAQGTREVISYSARFFRGSWHTLDHSRKLLKGFEKANKELGEQARRRPKKDDDD